MATKVIKTAGQVAFEGLQGELKTPMPWDNCSIKAAWEAFAAKHNIQPLTEEVPEPPTDGALLVKAYDTKCDEGTNAVAAEFLRLRAERDGTSEPLPVKPEWFLEFSKMLDIEMVFNGDERCRRFAEAVNQHRGVRPVPQVTAEMLEQVLRRDTLRGAAESLNAELAKAAPTATAVQPVKVAACAFFDGGLHTFENTNDQQAFLASHPWEFGSFVDEHVHHARKDGGK